MAFTAKIMMNMCNMQYFFIPLIHCMCFSYEPYDNLSEGMNFRINCIKKYRILHIFIIIFAVNAISYLQWIQLLSCWITILVNMLKPTQLNGRAVVATTGCWFNSSCGYFISSILFAQYILHGDYAFVYLKNSIVLYILYLLVLVVL